MPVIQTISLALNTGATHKQTALVHKVTLHMPNESCSAFLLTKSHELTPVVSELIYINLSRWECEKKRLLSPTWNTHVEELNKTSNEKVLNKNRVFRTATKRRETSPWPPKQCTYMYSTVAVIKKFPFRFVWTQTLTQNRRWMSDERSKDDWKMNAPLSS